MIVRVAGTRWCWPSGRERRLAWLFSEVARSGVKVSRRAAASTRYSVTACSLAARASSGRPRADSRLAWLFSKPARCASFSGSPVGWDCW